MIKHSMERWWVYQKERFPLVAHGPLIAAMAMAAVGLSHIQNAQASAWPFVAWLVAWLNLVGFFFLLRVADEFKDYETDCQYRPYRAVPRGLVSLRELGVAAALVMVAQLGTAVWFGPPVLITLLTAWLWLALMTREFFVPIWLKARPLLYLLSHMLIMPLLMLYAISHYQAWVGSMSVQAVVLLLSLALVTGLCLEIGRKIRRPSDEETGVETYSAVWGRAPAALSWAVSLWVSLGLCLLAVRTGTYFDWAMVAAAVLAFLALVLTTVYFFKPEMPSGRWFEGLSAVTLLTCYLLIGVMPWMTQSA